MVFNKEAVLNMLEGIKLEFKGLARLEMHRSEDPGLNKDFHEGKESAYYVAMDVIDDSIKAIKNA